MADSRLTRRDLLGAIVAASAGGACLPLAAQPADPRRLPPQENDRLVIAAGARAGEPISPSQVVSGARPLIAYPADPASDAVRSASPLNQIAVLRLDEMSPETAARAADGVVAYSAVCTHSGCEVTDRDPGTGWLLCPCHESAFDPVDNARVRGGPAVRRLAALPLKVVDGTLVVAGGFIGRVGADEPAF